MSREAIEKIVRFINDFIEGGCPPSGDCENYKVSEEDNTVDCEMCLKGEIEKLLTSLGYRLIPEHANKREAVAKWLRAYTKKTTGLIDWEQVLSANPNYFWEHADQILALIPDELPVISDEEINNILCLRHENSYTAVCRKVAQAQRDADMGVLKGEG